MHSHGKEKKDEIVPQDQIMTKKESMASILSKIGPADQYKISERKKRPEEDRVIRKHVLGNAV